MAHEKDVQRLLDEAIAQTGWNADSQVAVLLRYIGSQQDNASFADFLTERISDELDGTPSLI